MTRFDRRVALLALILPGLALLAGLVVAQPAPGPPGYYGEVDTSNATTLRESVHEAIRGNVRISFGSGANWPILEEADQDPNGDVNNPTQILDIYKNELMALGQSPRPYDREHVWPQSRGFAAAGDSVGGLSYYPRSDLHNLYLCDPGYNSSRGNNYFAFCPAPGCDERATDFNNGVGGNPGSGYPGWSNWRSGETWEVWADRRGDAARAVMYMAVRYEGGTHPVDGNPEPDLRLTNNPALFDTGVQAIAYMGLLSDILEWHQQDPPDDKERFRHEIVADAQQNRNPFIDYPEWGDCIFLDDCSEVAPIEPQRPFAQGDGDSAITVYWDPRPETDLAGYNVYRSTTSGGPYDLLNTGLVVGTTYVDTTAGPDPEQFYYYVVTAEDTDGNESFYSVEVSSIIGDGPLGSELFMSEYVEGSSFNKAVEIYNPTTAPVTLTGNYQLWIYFNGSETAQSQIALNGTIDPGEVFIISHTSADPVILALGNQTAGNLSFNGDDAIELRNMTGGGDGEVIDSLGEVGFQPPGGAWTGGGISTQDMTLVRRPEVLTGRTNSTDPFDPSVEWIGHPNDTFDFLGFHEVEDEDPPTSVGDWFVIH